MRVWSYDEDVDYPDDFRLLADGERAATLIVGAKSTPYEKRVATIQFIVDACNAAEQKAGYDAEYERIAAEDALYRSRAEQQMSERGKQVLHDLGEPYAAGA